MKKKEIRNSARQAEGEKKVREQSPESTASSNEKTASISGAADGATASSLNDLSFLHINGRFVEMEEHARALIGQDNDSGSAWRALSIALRSQGKDALSALLRTTELLPSDCEVHNSLGNALMERGQIAEAVVHYRRALQIKSDFAEALSNLGNALTESGQFDEAIRNLQDALAIKPHLVSAHYNLGNVQREIGRFDEAEKSYREAIRLSPNLVEGYNNLGSVFRSKGLPDEATSNFLRALAIKPNYTVAYNNLLLTSMFVDGLSAEDLFSLHRKFGEQFETPLMGQWKKHSSNLQHENRMKIGYVSGDFRQHPVAYFIEPILANHDRTQFEIFCYSNSIRHDAYTKRLSSQADHWINVCGMSDDELARRIRADEIDILVDLAGHNAYNRLLTFARKPAPVQITYLGYPGTSGLTAMDYRLTDSFTEPESLGSDQYYTEKLLRMPNSLWCYKPRQDMPEVTPLPALANGYLTFGSFNNVDKVGSESVNLWAMLLHKIPDSRLTMATVPGGELRERFRNLFAAKGIDAKRLSFVEKTSPDKFYRELQKVDITLDPYPVNGATTTCESLWLGVPVLTLAGNRFLSRAGLSILQAAKLPDFALITVDSYVQTAVLLAQNLPLLSDIRMNMRNHLHTTPLLDQRQFTKNLESTYLNAWETWRSSHDR